MKVDHIYGDNAFIVPWGMESRRKLGADFSINKGDIVSTEKGAKISLLMNDGSVIRLNEDTVIYFSRLESKPKHVSLNVVQGEIYIETTPLLSAKEDFIVVSPRMISQVDATTALIDTFPVEKTKVLRGTLSTRIFHLVQDRKEPLVSAVIHAGEEVSLEADVINAMVEGEDFYPRRFDDSGLDADGMPLVSWYDFVSGGAVVAAGAEAEAPSSDSTESAEVLVADSGSVSISLPHEGAQVGATVTVSGRYDHERIAKIFVNDRQADLNVQEESWQAYILLSSSVPEIIVNAEDIDGNMRSVGKRSVSVDDKPPTIPDIIEPEVDENGRGQAYGDSIVITGRAHHDIAKISVTADTHSPYQLMKYSPGDDLFYYKASKSIGNLHDGSNVYTIQFFDEFGNVSTKTLTITLLRQEYEGIGVFSNDQPIQIVEPSQSPYRTAEETVSVRGVILSDVQKILVNGEPVVLDGTTSEFTYSATVGIGENPLVFSVENSLSEIVDVGVLTIIRE